MILYINHIYLAGQNPDNLTPNLISAKKITLEHVLNVLDIKPLDIFITNLKIFQKILKNFKAMRF